MSSSLLQKRNSINSKVLDNDTTPKTGVSMPAVSVLQNKPVQKQGLEEELPIQGKDTAQKKSINEALPLQAKVTFSNKNVSQSLPAQPIQKLAFPNNSIQKKENNTGLPDNLKSGVENLSGFAMDDVKVHYNSDKPKQLQALAYAQGTDIHVAPGQEKHLPHEAWHVAQQKQGRVQPTMQMKQGVQVNDEKGLENEADVMGAKSMQFVKAADTVKDSQPVSGANVIQAKAYNITRSFPLETHFSLIEVPKKVVPQPPPKVATPLPGAKAKAGKATVTKPKAESTRVRTKKKATDAALGKLREAYPITTEQETQAKLEKWGGEERDQLRGDEFLLKRKELMDSLNAREIELGIKSDDPNEVYHDPNEDFHKLVDADAHNKVESTKTATGYWVRGAHVKGLSVVNERTRKNTPESNITKSETGMTDWIGAHLIKREWGGEDNMWNVVSWPLAAEKKWGADFEEEIDRGFANGTLKKLDISVNVEKEDEAISKHETDAFVNAKIAGKSDNWTKVAIQKMNIARMIANRAMEGIPKNAVGTSPLGTANINVGDTKWNEAKAGVLAKLKNKVDDKEPSEKLLTIFETENGPDKEHPEKKKLNPEEKKQQFFDNEREEALKQEKENYRSERFNVTHNV